MVRGLCFGSKHRVPQFSSVQFCWKLLMARDLCFGSKHRVPQFSSVQFCRKLLMVRDLCFGSKHRVTQFSSVQRSKARLGGEWLLDRPYSGKEEVEGREEATKCGRKGVQNTIIGAEHTHTNTRTHTK